ncbi:MAG: glycosyltransferase family 39 protein [Gemmatimonadetes bacterium]|nr:glycosyltransferase family 39 protein [Gemmatimonadota bacterium]
MAGAVALVGLVFGLTAHPLLDPDEGRNAEVAREMAATNDYILPQLDGLPYPDKPVLFFAVEAAVMELLGPTVPAARLPPLGFTLATIGTVAWFARRRGGSNAAWTAAVAAAASPLTLGFARTVIFDSTLTFFVVAALAAFYEAISDRAWHWSTLGWAAIALAVLTKGPIGLALPLMIAIPYAVWRRAGRVLWAPAGPLLCTALLLPWLMAMSRRVPEFLSYALGTETLARLTTPALGRTGPWWYFLPILLAGALPWSVAALAGLAKGGWRGPDRKIDPYVAFLLCWMVVPLVFFSLSQSKRPQYVLPLVPAIALLVAHLWRGNQPAGAQAAAGTLIAAGLLIGAAPGVLPRLLPLSSGIRDAIPGTAAALGAVTVVCGALTWFLRRRDRVLLALAVPVATIPIAGGELMRQIGRERSSAELAAAIARVLPPGADVVAVAAFPLSLPFYLRQPVLLASATGAELTSNYLVRDLARWRLVPGSPLRPADWWHDAAVQCGRVKVFVTRADDAQTRAVLAAQVPLLVATAKFAAYGPCARSDLASRRRRLRSRRETFHR